MKTTEIKIGQWYMFNCQSDKDVFLDIAFENSSYLRLNYTKDFFENREVLQFCQDDGSYKLKYRTKYDSKYVTNVKFWTPFENKISNTFSERFSKPFTIEPIATTFSKDELISQLSDVYERMFKGKGENNMNEMLVNNLINEVVSKKHQEINKQRDEQTKVIIANSDLAKAASKYADAINKTRDAYHKIDFEYILRSTVNTYDDTVFGNEICEQLKAVNETCEKTHDALNNQMNELKALLSITDTYEQKAALLKEYHIVED